MQVNLIKNKNLEKKINKSLTVNNNNNNIMDYQIKKDQTQITLYHKLYNKKKISIHLNSLKRNNQFSQSTFSKPNTTSTKNPVTTTEDYDYKQYLICS